MATPAKKIDLGPYSDHPDYITDLSVKRIEDPAEKTARLANEAADASHARWRGDILFGAVLIGVAIIVLACLYLAVREAGSPDDRKWAMTILGSIVSAGVGFLTGRHQGR